MVKITDACEGLPTQVVPICVPGACFTSPTYAGPKSELTYRRVTIWRVEHPSDSRRVSRQGTEHRCYTDVLSNGTSSISSSSHDL